MATVHSSTMYTPLLLTVGHELRLPVEVLTLLVPAGYESISTFPIPTTITQLRQFFGIPNSYRSFILNCATIPKPLTCMVGSKCKSVELTPGAEVAFSAAKEVTFHATKLCIMTCNPNVCLRLITDLSNYAVGAVLEQSSVTLDIVWKADTSVKVDHKPATLALYAKPDRYSPRGIKYLDYISDTHVVTPISLSTPYQGLMSTHSSFGLVRMATAQLCGEDRKEVSTCFDRVSHGPLKHKLEAYGNQRVVLRRIASFLDNRTSRVETGSDVSSPSSISAGVFQGSVLGPLLFFVCINDLPNNISSNTLLYADDLKLWNATDPGALQIDLDAIKRWSGDWSLPLNDNKCVRMSLGGDSGNAFMIHSASSTVDIMKVHRKKDLSIWLSSNLSFTYHHEMATKKVFAALMMTRRTFHRIDKKAFRTLYGIDIRPLLEYANQVVYTGLKKDILAVERFQRAATKVVAGLSNVTYRFRLEILDLYPLEFQRLRGDLMLTYLFFRAGLVEQFFTVANGDGQRGHNKQLFKLRPRTFLRQQFFSYRANNYWNSLPSEIIGSASRDRFKALLDSHSSKILSCE
ncbi:uncharacterized protein DEA37_0002048 [Paragonimus westermani]|uniref:Reverse transcriptase domain-containing protein n=1 Tax=Paragonimus westermani TaxID=34504 RepID=A0A5J4P2T1_9TREM|nr:uncharacterized protein DEA37_0002048 [Paragonimus westermani]